MRINWKYFVKLPSGSTLELSIRDNVTAFYIGLIIVDEDILEKDEKEANKFISINLMTEKAKILTEKYILNKKLIPFWISDNGQLFLGETIK